MFQYQFHEDFYYLFQEGNPLLGQPAVWGPKVEEFRERVNFVVGHFAKMIQF